MSTSFQTTGGATESTKQCFVDLLAKLQEDDIDHCMSQWFEEKAVALRQVAASLKLAELASDCLKEPHTNLVKDIKLRVPPVATGLLTACKGEITDQNVVMSDELLEKFKRFVIVRKPLHILSMAMRSVSFRRAWLSISWRSLMCSRWSAT